MPEERPSIACRDHKGRSVDLTDMLHDLAHDRMPLYCYVEPHPSGPLPAFETPLHNLPSIDAQGRKVYIRASIRRDGETDELRNMKVAIYTLEPTPDGFWIHGRPRLVSIGEPKVLEYLKQPDKTLAPDSIRRAVEEHIISHMTRRPRARDVKAPGNRSGSPSKRGPRR